MEMEEDTIVIEVNNEDWQEGEEGSYHEYHVTELDGVKCGEGEEERVQAEGVEYGEGLVASYTEEVGTQVLHDGREMNARVVTYENIPAKGEIYVNSVQDGEVHASNVESNEETVYKPTVQNDSEVQHSLEYQDHKMETQKQFSFSCPYCPMKYSNKALLKAHVWVHPQHMTYTCRVCNSSFKSKAEVDEHARRHFYNKNCFCRLCGASLSCKASCIKHMRKTHGVDDENIDLFMLKEVTNDGKMMLVIRTVRNGKVYKRKFNMMKEQ